MQPTPKETDRLGGRGWGEGGGGGRVVAKENKATHSDRDRQGGGRIVLWRKRTKRPTPIETDRQKGRVVTEKNKATHSDRDRQTEGSCCGGGEQSNPLSRQTGES